MKDSFVNNTQDIFSANQSQMRKIQFLTKQKAKADLYIKDLQQSLRFNKNTVRVINNQGPNDKAIQILNQQNLLLHQRLKNCYDQNRDLNSQLLFQRQIRIQDKSFYNQRVLEFENRISDLRKYLHDKQDSFSNVVNRLKKYQEINQMGITQKLNSFKNQIGQDITKNLLSCLSHQRNIYQKMYKDLVPKIKRLQILQIALKNKVNYQRYKQSLQNNQNDSKSDDGIQIQYQSNLDKLIPKKITVANQTNKKFPINPNKQLIRLIKKQKISNDILEQALNQAIQKNQQLINYNDKLTQANNHLEDICSELRAQIVTLQGYLASYQDNYKRKNHKYQSKCDLAKNGYQYSNFKQIAPVKGVMKKMVREVQKISLFMGNTKKKMMVKSCSQPRLTQDVVSQDEISIEQF